MSGWSPMVETSILILTKNEERNIRACLRAIRSQKYAGTFEVTVADSGWRDATLEIARRYAARIEQVPTEMFHHARARNYATSLAKAQILHRGVRNRTPHEAFLTFAAVLRNQALTVQIGMEHYKCTTSSDHSSSVGNL